jgi:NADH:ubiquinone oxidoreductase subunit 5 (subunit L)/multisubunit Na+/H+ antiporter MnhA subunit
MDYLLLFAIFLPLLGCPLLAWLGTHVNKNLGYAALVFPVVSFLSVIAVGNNAGWQGSTVVELPWIPTLGINLSFLIDGLSLVFGLIVSGMGCFIAFYSNFYLDEGHYKYQNRFYCYLILFMGAMLGTVFSNNLLLLFSFWELTGIASFLLIGFSHEKEDSRSGARAALLVTASTGLCMLAGLILLSMLYGGGLSLQTILSAKLPENGKGMIQASLLLVMLGAFGKSAQFPFHFWLPGAMAAPTPVSAYLHSATMVKLGVFLTARLYPAFVDLYLWAPVLIGISFTTMVLGAMLALLSNDLKAILAFATVSQLGYFIGFYGMGQTGGVEHDFYHLWNHVFYKGAFFMLAGIIDHAAGARDVRKLGGLWKKLPVVGIAWILCAAALAGLPPTTGFVSKELMLETTLHLPQRFGFAGVVALLALVTTALLNVAVACRLVYCVLFGKMPGEVERHFHRPSITIQIAPAILVFCILIFGMFPQILGNELSLMNVPGLHESTTSHLALFHGFNLPLLLTFISICLGAGVFYVGQLTRWEWTVIPRFLRFDDFFESSLVKVTRISMATTRLCGFDRPTIYLFVIIGFSLFFVGIFSVPFLHTPTDIGWRVLMGDARSPLRMFVALLISAAVVFVTLLKQWTTQLIALSVAGFLITFYFVLYRAPDLALTQILVETASLIMTLILLGRFPVSAEEGEIREYGISVRRSVAAVAGVATAILMAGMVLWITASPNSNKMGNFFARNTKDFAHGTNAVNTILVDFRGFDTLGEITVLLAAALGGIGLLMRYKRSPNEWRKGPREIPGYTLESEGNGEIQ